MQSQLFKKRLFVIFILFFLLLTLLFLKCLYLQVLKFDKFSRLAHNQQSKTLILEPQRGKIFDINKNILATNLGVNSVYAEPHRIKDFTRTVNVLKETLKLKEDFIIGRLSQPKFFVWIKRKITDEETQALEKLNLAGIGLLRETKRYYPNDSLAGHVLGFVDIDNNGLEGLELYYDYYLRGIKGYKGVIHDAYLRELSAFSRLYMPQVDGFNLNLTIDAIIQHITETALAEGMEKFNARAASAVVINPHTGEILAMANMPLYNPNFLNTLSEENQRNRAIADMFEPGSAFKIVTASAALEENLVSLDDQIFCEKGAYRVASHTLHDHRPHDWLSFQEVIVYSSNIGTVKVAQALGDKGLYKYIKLYGFGSATNIDLPGEISGSIKHPSKWSKVSIACIPMGQEVGVTALQMTTAISVIANGGYLIKPYIVSIIEDNEGHIIKAVNPHLLKKRIISQETSQQMKDILTEVVKRGTGRMAKPKDFSAAGKTGTAQKIDETGRYSHSKYMASFIGFAPADNPKIAVCVVFDEPRPIYYGGSVAGPVFSKIADATLKYLGTK